jgi:predicted CXXCH cytochrome family protein
MPGDPSQLASDRPLALLAGQLIFHGLVDATTCINRGLLKTGAATPCGEWQARHATIVWQNQFDDEILKAARKTGVPPFILKNVLIKESQFWPETYQNPRYRGEYGMGHTTSLGVDTLLSWNHDLYKTLCTESYSPEACRKEYVFQEPAIKEGLKGLILKPINADCPNCVGGVDLKRARASILITAETLASNRRYIEWLVNGFASVSQLAPINTWRFTLASYNAGSGCFSQAFYETRGKGNPLSWVDVSERLDQTCKSAIGYVDFVMESVDTADPAALRLATTDTSLATRLALGMKNQATAGSIVTLAPTATNTGSETPTLTVAGTLLTETLIPTFTGTPLLETLTPTVTITGTPPTATPTLPGDGRRETPTPTIIVSVTETPLATTETPTPFDGRETPRATGTPLTETPTIIVTATETSTPVDGHATPTSATSSETPTPTLSIIGTPLTATPTPPVAVTETLQTATKTPTPVAGHETPTSTISLTGTALTETPVTGSETPVISSMTPTPALTTTPSATPVVQPTAFVPPDAETGEVMVKFGDLVPDFLAENVIVSAGGEIQEQVENLDVKIISAPQGEVSNVLAYLQSSMFVEYAEPNYTVQAFYTPNDPGYASQTYLANMQVPDAWDVTKGDGIIVAVIDTGVDILHPDLASNIWVNPGEDGLDDNGKDKRTNFFDDDQDGYVDNWMGWNFVGNNNDARDGHGHGTHSAGIIAAQMDNAQGISGIAPNAKIMAIKALDNTGFGSYSQVAQAIIYAVDHGAKVINLGFGGTAESEALLAATNYAYAHDVVVVAAGGNTGSNVLIYPAANPNVIGVSALDENLNAAVFSSYSDAIQISAPGVGIYSTVLGKNYATMSGTSMSAAQVSGVVALLAAKPQFDTVNKIRSALLESARDLGAPGTDQFYGHGLAHALDALNFSSNGTPTPTLTPDGTPTPTQTPDGSQTPTATPVGGVSIMADMAASDITQYAPSCTTPGFTPLVGGTIVPALAADEARSTVDIGFDFWYMGAKYTQLVAGSNGWLSFGPAGGNYAVNDLDNSGGVATNIRPVLAPLWDDLSGTGGTASYLVQGTAPNRTFTFEWLNWRWDNNAGGPVMSFQVVLHEGTGVIDFNYRNDATGVSNTNGGASIGITGSANSSWLSASNVGVCPPTWSVLTEDLNTKPVTDSQYTFTPPFVTLNPPSNLSMTAITTTSLTLNWNDNSTGEDGFGIYTSTDGVNYVYFGQAAANATSFDTSTVAPLSNSAKNYWKVYAAVEGNASAAADVTAPTALTFTAVKAASMTLNWIDNSSNETGFYIYRSANNINFTQIAKTAAASSSYTASGLTAGVTYYWRVQSVADSTAETAVSAAATGSQITNTLPVVVINAPASNTTYAKHAPITFTGVSTDAEDGNLTSTLAWYSDLTGPLTNSSAVVLTGGSITVTNLLPGKHTITARSTDANGDVGAASIKITVEPLFGPHGSFNGSTSECVTCHRSHSAQGPNELINFPSSSKSSNDFCLSCHDGTTASAVSTHSNIDAKMKIEAQFEVLCVQCHNPHGTSNLFAIRSDVLAKLNPDTTKGPVIFSALTGNNTPAFPGINSFDDGVSPASSRICVTCHDSATMANNHAGGADHKGGIGNNYTGQSCISCHPHDADGNRLTKDGFAPVRGACDSCHGAPPATGAHVTHSNPVTPPTVYGETGVHNTQNDYDYACGECHPTNVAKHMDGTVQVDLNPSPALPADAPPATALKTKNGAGASYAGNTCSNTYCHSGETVSSGAVGSPLTDGGGNPILDLYYNFTYAPYTVTTTRSYKATPNWNTGVISGNCTDCHDFPLRTAFPSVEAGVGDSHQWVDDSGYGNLHAYNMGFAPLSCNTCHYGEITALGTSSRSIMDVTTYDPLPIDNHTLHANGLSNITFTVAPIVYNTSSGPFTVNLGSALYNPNKKACGNVGCHLDQSYVVWGTPYRWGTSECGLCHRDISGLPKLGVVISMGASADPNPTTHPAIPAGSTCQTCHVNPHAK